MPRSEYQADDQPGAPLPAGDDVSMPRPVPVGDLHKGDVISSPAVARNQPVRIMTVNRRTMSIAFTAMDDTTGARYDFGLTHGQTATLLARPARRATRRVLADRMLLVSELEADDWAVKLPRPILIQAGQTYWLEESHLHVQSTDGTVTTVAGSGYALCWRR